MDFDLNCIVQIRGKKEREIAMENKALEDYTRGDLIDILDSNVDAILMVDTTKNLYRSIARKGFFLELLEETGDYSQLIEKLWFHLSETGESISDDYKAFVSYYGKYRGKTSRRLTIYGKESDKPHIIQMNVYPIKDTDKYIYCMDELDDYEYVEEHMTTNKVSTIQSTYLFSMFVDLAKDTTSSISVTEISDETVDSDIKYSQWRLMTVNMIWPDDQQSFLELTDPDNLKVRLEPGCTASIECKMKNLEGIYIWVKLTFCRARTSNNRDFRYVFMVQDINESYEDLMTTLKKYEDKALEDSLTGLLNRGSTETEIRNAIDGFKNGGEQVSLMMLDLDNFKNVNDTHGHAVGDETLKTFAAILQNCAKGKNATVGRWGGEEFIISICDTSREDVLSFAEEVRKSVEEYDFCEAGRLTCSIGVSHLEPEDSFEDVYDRMDKAMYSSKEAGRNRVTQL